MVLPRRYLDLGLAGAAATTLTNLASAAPLISRTSSLPPNVRLAAGVDSPSEQLIRLSYGLKLQRTEGIGPLLRSVSDPSSVDYGRHLSRSEIGDLFGPTAEARDQVAAYLRDQGARNVTVSDDGLSVGFVTTVQRANEMLEADFNWYDVGDGKRRLRTRGYAVRDEGIARHVDVVSPANYFGGHGQQRAARRLDLEGSARRAGALDGRDSSSDEMVRRLSRHDKRGVVEMAQVLNETCPRLITPPCIRELYGLGEHRTDNSMGSRVGFVSFLGQSAVESDLDKFTDMFNLPAPGDFESVEINGGIDHQDHHLGVQEGNLDAQMMALGAQDLPITHYVVGGSPPIVPNVRLSEEENDNEPYLEFYSYLMGQENEDIPQVISLSYADDEQTVPMDYAIRTCNLMGLMGIRGVSVLEASGDGGVGGACRANDGTDRLEFTPQFPPTCPYVTAVGGTMGYMPEKAWWGSSGGFSNYFPRPWYQDRRVADYFDTHLNESTKEEFAQYANYSGRSFPDMAAHSMSPNYQIIIGGASGFSGGTSAATPLVAGMIGMINAERLRRHKPPMGFLNPFLYSLQSGEMNDIVEGRSNGCDGYDTQTGMPIEGAGVINERGVHWEAVEGWDPVTGVGTPNFEKMLSAALRLPRDL